MPIEVRLDAVLADGEMTSTDLSNRVGITLAIRSSFETGKARAVRFSTLETICEVLDCRPGDLLTSRG